MTVLDHAIEAVPTDLLEQLASLKRPVIVGHMVPDADCLAAMFSAALTWPIGREEPAAVCLPPGSVSQRLAFLVEWAAVPVVGPEGLADADGFIAVDTARKRRCNVGADTPEDFNGHRPLINIDHHTSNTGFGTVNWVVDTASSSSELIWALIHAAQQPITPVIASLLYAGLMGDTQRFSLPNTSAQSLHVAAALVGAGAKVGELGERLYRCQQISEFKLLRTIYANTHLTADGRLAYSSAGYEEITSTGCGPEDIDEQVEVPRSLAGVQMALLFTEGVRGKTRINFRAESNFTVLELAQEFGGGGHAQAAGAVLDCSLAEAMAQVLPAAERHLDK